MSSLEVAWPNGFGSVGRDLAAVVTADGYQPDPILSIARGGRFVAGAPGHVLETQGPVVET